jgi:hypothetical protein
MASTPTRRGSFPNSTSNTKSPNRWIPIVSPLPTTTTTDRNDGNSSGNPYNKTLYGNKHVDAELEALKQRGLAKMLNKHFTETALQLEIEKAAADAAVRDLEERKARTSEYTGPQYDRADTMLSPLDEMRIQANKWRAECRRKERETMLLYQRYVHRFGDTLHSIVPHATPDTPWTSSSVPPPRPATPSPATTTGAAASATPAGSLVPNMAKQIEATLEEYMKQGAVSMPSLQTLGKDETYQNVQKKEEDQFRNFYRRQLEQKGIDVKYPGFSLTGRPDFPGFPINTIEEKRNTSNSGGNHDNDNDDDESVMSELTTLQSVIIQDCERSVVTYLQEEHQKIQSLIRGDDNDDDDYDDENESAVSQAESMVQQMEEILAEYQNTRPNHSSLRTKHAKSQHPPREYPTDNNHEHWTVYYDEFYQQDYYHEKNTNRTQWEPPGRNNNNNDSTSCSSATCCVTVAEVMPDMRVYRQRRRAQRRSRRTNLLLWSTVVVTFLAVLWQYDRHHVLLRSVLPTRWAQYLPDAKVTSMSRELDFAGSEPDDEPSNNNNVSTVLPPATTAITLFFTPSAKLTPVATTTVTTTDEDNDVRKTLEKNRIRPWLGDVPIVGWLLRTLAAVLLESTVVIIATTDHDDDWLCSLPLVCWLHHQCWTSAKLDPKDINSWHWY